MLALCCIFSINNIVSLHEKDSIQFEITGQKFEKYLSLHGYSLKDVDSYEIFKPYRYSNSIVRVKYINDEYIYEYEFDKDTNITEDTCIPKSCLVYDIEGTPVKSDYYENFKFPTTYNNSKSP